ncbi:MAG TPA: hypothetical protein VNC61_10205 [Acidimicrobiales bacterium]|nr:hypothetical protein [Acidimicrobiales bacterium]
MPLLRPGLAALVFLALLASIIVGAGSVRPASAAPQPYGGQCPGGTSQCVQVQLPCQTSPCPSVVAGPNQDLDTDEYVYLALSNYPAGDTVRIAYCATDGSGTIDSDPYCATNTSGGIRLSKQFVAIGPTGSTAAAMPVAYDPPGQDNPSLAAVPLVQNGQPAGSFYCDNSPNFCAIVITDDGATGAGPTDTAANTVVVPLDFSAGASACPSTDPQLFTDSSFTVEHLIPAVVQATCGQKNGVVALDTATNTGSEIDDLAGGNTPIAFTDDPWDTQLDSALTSGKFAYIPVALSATVVGFLGGAPDETQSGVVFPLAQYNMTPNMVAGVLTTSYEGGGTTDSLITAPTNQKPPLNCNQIVGCNKKTMIDYNTFYLLNPEPTGVGQPGSIGSFFSNTVAGTNYQLSDWMCAAPNAPFQLTVQKSSGPTQVAVTDTYNPASATLTTPPTQSPFWNPNTLPSEWPFKTCEPTSQFPTLSPGSLTQYQPADTPALQAKAIRAYGSSGNLAFGAMDWSESTFNGVNVVAVQNAAGNFVTPTQTSITAAMSDAKAQSDGTLTFNYDDVSNSAAYPMPMVTYAVVPTTPVPADQARSVSAFLTNMVAFSSGKDGTLPGGYVPLPASLVTEATQDIAKDIVAGSPDSSGSSGSSGSSASTSSSGSSTGQVPSSTQTGAGAGNGRYQAQGSTGLRSATGSSTASSAPTTAPAQAGAGDKGTPAPRQNVIAADFNVIVGGTKDLIPLLMALALAAIVAGPALLAWPRRRRSIQARPPDAVLEGSEP